MGMKLRGSMIWVTCFKSHSGCRASGKMRDGLKRGMRNLLGVMKMFCILIVVVVSWVHTSVKTHQIIPSNCTIESNHLLYVNYNSINYKKLKFNFLATVCGMDGRGQE